MTRADQAAKQVASDPDYFRELGRRGGKATVARHGRKFLSEIGKRGGKRNAKKGRQHFERIGAQGGARLRDLVEKGKNAEAR